MHSYLSDGYLTDLFSVQENTSILSPEFWGAFWGAFLAFLFGLLAFYLQKKRERYITHKNALVKIEHLLFEHCDEIAINKQHAETANKIFAGTEINATDYRFNLFRVPSDISLELTSVNFINKYFEYIRSVARTNVNMDAKNRAITRVEDILINQGQITSQTRVYIAYSMSGIAKSLDEMEQDLIEMLAWTRLYLQKAMEDKIYILKIMFKNKTDWTIPRQLLEDTKNDIVTKGSSDNKS